jgi:hypothetical protein
VSVIEILERHCFVGRVIHGRIAARYHDSSAVAANPIGEAVDERKMAEVIADKLKFDTATPRWDGGVGAFRVRDDGIQRTKEVADRIHRRVDRVEIGKVAGNRRRRCPRLVARRASLVERSCEADDMRTVGNEGLHGFESNAAMASGHDHPLAGQIDACQHLISS